MKTLIRPLLACTPIPTTLLFFENNNTLPVLFVAVTCIWCYMLGYATGWRGFREAILAAAEKH